MNSFGNKFKLSLFGESHGNAIGVVMDGIPPGMKLGEEDFAADLERRRSGKKGTTPRIESDKPEILSGTFNGHTTGAPLAVIFSNENTRSGDYANLAEHPRPSHADWVANKKFEGFNDYRGGGHFSGRITLALVTAGVVAKKILAKDDINISARLIQMGGSSNEGEFKDILLKAVTDGDSVGGVIECRAENVPAGLGEPFFDSVESVLSHLLFSIPAVKGVEFGNGFAAAALRGSQNNDRIISAEGKTATNNSGGINGGITNGNPVVVRVAVKPTSSISAIQETFNMKSGRIEPLKIVGRHDACIALRVPVVVEAAMAIALAQF